ncbi:MAG: hypothetical protein A2653_00945 [Candidatus Zambryskibacteria bacterium RIFCSPHIGHO2_01_FULL_43_25]|uniref:PKD/Chitinase domain-containing protein n=1 Tax=Candidatus Zambryskibacteria bacterium RIFCSPLOWO2_01_FULL_45_21 TaxID=1802761 RepID=A0A1G2U454_9BACT|nr:MAG: hypothetical protein A2653_00945 [Candidatus Zambryskibacteria bacterium RIFCSPHIGHO2_01_FULL_43_25]OHB00443.1 MAG: hypothetical protein A3E94_00490 [Candidatus Zambryskibacteria bacterium RIFCSPHIGHO2_12_FULL_44_12b]OHB04284.1 MAG: hypothetical protein A3B14_01910 [Candidatus Zambryskibacteria bacterium RIFCSPLOWO2_01_FULL_45_21]
MSKVFLKLISIILLLIIAFPLQTLALPNIPILPTITEDEVVPVADEAIRRKEVGESSFQVFGRRVTITGLTLDSIVILASKAALEELSDSLVDWINSGFTGYGTKQGPQFVTDPEGFLKNTADAVGGKLISTIVGPGSAICAPFQAEIETALTVYLKRTNIRSTDPLYDQCTLSGIVNNIDAFLDGNFSEGGWDGWVRLTQGSTNNPYSAYIETKNALILRTAQGQETELARWNWADGFLDLKKCKTPGVPPPPLPGEPDPDPNSSDYCEEWEIQTPGRVVESQLEKHLSSEITQLELADELDEIFSALVGQLRNKVFGGGGLFKLSGSYTSGGPSGARGSLNVSCSPNNSNIILGGSVEWNANAYSATSSLSYSWSINGTVLGTGKSFTWTPPAVGTYKATVTVTDGVNTATATCQPSVFVSRYAPLQVSCEPLGYVVNGQIIPAKWTQYTMRIGTDSYFPVAWQATLTGGSGHGNIYWRGDSGADISRDQTTINRQQPGEIIFTLYRYYYDKSINYGAKTLGVGFMDADQTVQSIGMAPNPPVSCNGSIEIVDPNIKIGS